MRQGGEEEAPRCKVKTRERAGEAPGAELREGGAEASVECSQVGRGQRTPAEVQEEPVYSRECY